MNTPQWMATLSLALEIPFDSSEDKIWSKLLDKFTKFGDVFITTLSTLDIVRLPFIDYSFVKCYYALDNTTQKKYQSVFTSLQNEFQAHLRQRVISDILDLQQSDNHQLKNNLEKFSGKVTDLFTKHNQDTTLSSIIKFLKDLKQELKELEDEENHSESDSTE